MAEPLRRFYFDCLLPELLDSRYNRNMALREPDYVLEAQRELKRKVVEKASEVHEECVDTSNTSEDNRKAIKRKVTSQSKRKQKRTKPSIITAANVALHSSSDIESLGEADESLIDRCAIESNAESIEDRRNVLAALYADINMDNVYNNILGIQNLLNDDSIESIMKLIKTKEPQYEIHHTIYFQFYDLLPERFIGYHGKIHLQIIGGHPDYEHWICIRYDGKYLKIYDSLNRTNTTQLHPVEKDYLRYRYPQLKRENILFAPVTQQPDGRSCGVYAFAFIDDLILKKPVINTKYSQNATVMRNHAVTILRQQELQSFPKQRSTNLKGV